MKRTAHSGVAVLVALVLLLSACGGSSNDDAGSTSATETPSGKPAEAQVGGSSTVIQPADASSLDPSLVINSSSGGSAILNALYDVLYTIDPKTSEIEPRIATDFSSPDGITWTLKLRDDVTFTDGKPLDAEAVRFNWERHKGNQRASAFTAMQSVASMTVVDPATLEVVLTEPNRQFFQTIPYAGLVWIGSPAAIEAGGDNYSEAPVGAGPFILKSRAANSETVLQRNPDYWQEGLPKLDELRIRSIVDPQQLTDSVVTGAADAAVSVPDQFVVQAEAAGMKAFDFPLQGGIGWLFGMKKAPFDDLRARQAVYHALDVDDLLDQVAEGAPEKVTSLFLEDSPFYDPAFELPEHDPEEAQRLLDELAAEGKPLEFTILTPAGDSQTRAVALQTQLAKFDNVKANVKVADGSTYGISLFTGDFQLAAYGIGSPDPEPTFYGWHTKHPRPIASMGSAAIDEGLIEGRTAEDLAGRKAGYDKVQKAFRDVYGMLLVNVAKNGVIHSDEVTGLVTYGIGSQLFDRYGRVG